MYGLPQRPADDLVAEASTSACALPWIERLPRAFDTQVGLHGCQLSGGQRKTVAIARALLRQPKVLLCDEITSDLDPMRANAVLVMLRARAQAGVTVFAITHQLELAVYAQHALVFVKGVVVSYENNLQQDGQHSRAQILGARRK